MTDGQEKVNWPELLGPKKLSHRHLFIAHLAALGYSARRIHERTGVTESRLSLILNSQIMKDKIVELQKELFANDPSKALNGMVPKALDVVNQILDNPQERSTTRVDTAFRLLERTHGKPTQKIEVEGSLIKSLFDKLDQNANAQVVETQAQSVDKFLEDKYGVSWKEKGHGPTQIDGEFRESNEAPEGHSARPEQAQGDHADAGTETRAGSDDSGNQQNS